MKGRLREVKDACADCAARHEQICAMADACQQFDGTLVLGVDWASEPGKYGRLARVKDTCRECQYRQDDRCYFAAGCLHFEAAR